MAKYFYHEADSRGDANHGWLHSKHTFSFAGYMNAERMNFGVLRVLNDDFVSPDMGFGRHPHSNMEIISIPLEGELAHSDSMGTGSVIKAGDIQVMSAGTGIEHSEYNHSKVDPVKFLQIWIIPNKQNVDPRYEQQTIDKEKTHNNFLQILSPNADDEGVWIHQNAWFHLASFDAGYNREYVLKDPNNGLYVFVLKGDVEVGNQLMHTRDGLGIVGEEHVSIKATTNAEFLLMEVPVVF
ncbi:pirin family protein [Sphingobacterium sp. DK4209]|uniref:Pirin family protein n=1 Tax=Sphingobacterium zhuxiongii TaxID=2662364 RepID=A0A5Q0Q950_9SPHI|nr:MULTISPECIES: pirin family protein [unclassified Sphingobacterium]MVZ64456.1 pirin family protein [Sphingobacterium sp. DK4209]QGA25794.1 pirin family protein [Sphingobacterium sp. dk4302]